MRVLHVLEATGGGTARHVVDLSAGLAQRGVEVHVAYSPLRMDAIWRMGLHKLEQAGVILFPVPMRRAPHPSDASALFALRKYLNKAGPFTLVHGHSSKGGGLARLLRLLGGPPTIYTPNGFITLSPDISAGVQRVYAFVERGLSALTTALIAVSEDEAREAARLGYPAERICIIPNGIDLQAVLQQKREEIRRKWGVDRGDLVVGFVGRFAPQKAPQILLESFAAIAPQHPHARLVMVGSGPLEQDLRRRAEEMGIPVIWPGFMEGREAMQGFDIFALSSNYEGFPYVLLEAMAAGLPTVSTQVGGTELAITDGENGFLVPVGDIRALSRALHKLLLDGALRHRMGAENQKRVQTFSLDKMVDSTLGLYDEISRRQGAAGQR